MANKSIKQQLEKVGFSQPSALELAQTEVKLALEKAGLSTTDIRCSGIVTAIEKDLSALTKDYNDAIAVVKVYRDFQKEVGNLKDLKAALRKAALLSFDACKEMLREYNVMSPSDYLQARYAEIDAELDPKIDTLYESMRKMNEKMTKAEKVIAANDTRWSEFKNKKGGD